MKFKTIIANTGVEINKLFNTHGAKYRELDLKINYKLYQMMKS
ncbi:spx/MgsR family transcriptional regulator [Staphylococcus aureus]|nr:spx/MgsR family transcriptional regulator [Staphylococcus aureus]